MKSIFKCFALVAAAAMAFTACQNEIEVTTGGGDVEATTTVHVVANLNSTRSAFGDKIDAGYTSHWNGGEVAKAYVVSPGDYDNFYNVSASTPATVVAQDGAESATIDLAFSGTLSSGALYIITAADASVIDFEGAGYNYNDGQKPKITLPTEQTPDKDGKSVDPKAHILIYKDESFRPSKLNSLEVNFSHYAAYGKLNLRNAPEGVESYILDINGNKYIINSSRTTDVWFACEPAVVENMSVTVNAAAGAYTKKIVDNGSRALEFVNGEVSKFTVNMEGVTTGEAVDTFNPTYRLESLSWNGSGFFELITNYVVNGSTNTSMNLRIYMHEDDRPNNNSLKLGNYSCAGSGASTPSSAGTVNMRYVADTWAGWHATANASSTLSVSAENGVYVIVATINGQTWGYKGLPEGWPAPAGGGDVTPEPEDPTQTQLAQPTNLTATSTADTATISWTAVANASSYNVTVGETTKNVTTNTATFEGLTAETTYNVSVVAVGDGTNYTNSTAATTTVTTLATSTGGDDVVEDYTNWDYKAVWDTSSGLVTLTGNQDGRVITFVTDELAFTTFYGDTSKSDYFTDVKVNGVSATATAESWFKAARIGGVYNAEMDMTIDGVHYSGVASSFSF